MKKTIAVLLAALAVLSTACSKKSGFSSRGYAEEAPAADYQSDAARSEMSGRLREISASPAGDSPGSDAAQYAGPQAAAERKLVRRADIRIRAEDLAAADAEVNALMARHSAYASSSETSENARSYVIRVPSLAYDAFLSAMSGMGRILHRSESAEDVTLRYYDLEGRLATKKELLKTFQSYLGKAKDIEEILSVEERIAELQSEIDGTGRELRHLGDMVDYASISLQLYGPVAAVSNSSPTLPERIKELFGGFGDFLAAALVVLVGIVLYGIPVLLTLLVFFWLLFGRIGLMKKLWRAAAGKKQ
ncbi:MAG: DUF4349 domain-containing protein [Treponema sp.]|jgi:hypothetical protein|nr:DUF4349 domain-containing protein [Treponema sp.]